MDIAYVFCFQKMMLTCYCTGGCHLSEVLPGDHLYRLLQVQGVQPPLYRLLNWWEVLPVFWMSPIGVCGTLRVINNLHVHMCCKGTPGPILVTKLVYTVGLVLRTAFGVSLILIIAQIHACIEKKYIGDHTLPSSLRVLEGKQLCNWSSKENFRSTYY